MISDLIEKSNKENIKIEVFTSLKESNWIETFNNKLEKFVVSKNIGYDIKSLYKGKYLITSVTNLKDTDYIINSIKRNSILSDNTDISEFASNNVIKKNKFNELKYDINEIKEFLISLNDLKKEYKDLKTIITSFNYIRNEKFIENELIKINDENNFFEFDFEIIIKKGKKQETSYFGIYTNEFDKSKIRKKVIDKILSATDKLNSVTPDSVKTKVLLTNEVVSDIFFRFTNMFNGRNIRLKTSPLVDKVNTKIFSDKITITEDPTNEEMIVSKTFDVEGTPCYKKNIVENGVFKTILYDNKESVRANTKSTGNASGLNNCYICPGKKTFEELIKIMDNGIIIDRVEGLHSGTKTLTGDLSVQCQGYEVKNGKKDKAIKMFVMTSNIFELLGDNVIEVCNDLEFYGINGGCPSILTNNINISGK